VVLNCTEASSAVIQKVKEKSGMIVGSGYGKMKESQIRIANFPAVNLEQVQQLIETLNTI
jgi:phosphoserine aminotransferase